VFHFRFSCQWRHFPALFSSWARLNPNMSHVKELEWSRPQNHLRKTRGMGLGSRYNTASVCQVFRRSCQLPINHHVWVSVRGYWLGSRSHSLDPLVLYCMQEDCMPSVHNKSPADTSSPSLSPETPGWFTSDDDLLLLMHTTIATASRSNWPYDAQKGIISR
jgi:hypothetical protein